MIRMSLPLVLSLLATPLLAESTEPIVGRASVVDGDTVDIGKTRIRFEGIDAPESWQRCSKSSKPYRCGKEAADALDGFLAASRPLRCEPHYKEGRGRWVADCFRADGKSVNEWMVINGHAIDWPKYSGGKYAGLQAKAKARHLGIWQGRFELPCAVRDRRWKRESTCD
jgi:succinoglycan biosynthesis protein ExoI